MIGIDKTNMAYYLLILACVVMTVSSWSLPYHHPMHRVPMRVTRYAPPPPPYSQPVHQIAEEQRHRPKRDHDDYHHHHDHDHDHDHGHRGTSGVTGPVHTFVKTDKNANYKWGVRHHVGNKYAS